MESGKSTRLFAFLCFVIAFLVYSNTFNHEYVLDDDIARKKNRLVMEGVSGIPELMTHGFLYGFNGRNDQSYRPVVLVTFALEHEFFGLSPTASHVLNVLFYALCCALVFVVLSKVFHNWNKWWVFFIALLFVLHPVHTETVANVKGRDEVMQLLFLLCTLLFSIRYYHTRKARELIALLVSYYLALTSKEMSVTFLAIVPFLLWICFGYKKMPLARTIGTMLLVFVIYVIVRANMLDAFTFQGDINILNNTVAGAEGWDEKLATAAWIQLLYIKLLFFPHPLSWDYSYSQLPILSFADWRPWVAILVITGILIFGGYSAIIKRSRIGLGILFYFICMSVISNVFIEIGATLGERFLLTPSFGWAMALGSLVVIGLKGDAEHYKWKDPKVKIATSVLLLVSVLFAYKTYTRNEVWKTDLTLYKSGVKTAPNSSRAQASLGSAYRARGEAAQNPQAAREHFEKALPYYLKALDILPRNFEAWYNLGVTYYNLGEKDKALKAYHQALEYDRMHIDALNNIAVIHFERENYDLALKFLLKIAEYQPNNVNALGNIGAIYHNRGQYGQAVQYYEQALAYSPNNVNVLQNAVRAYQNLGNSQRANELERRLQMVRGAS